MSTTAAPRLPVRLRRPQAGPRLRSLVRGHAEDPAWARPALLAVLALSAVLCLWHLTRNGYANEYYAAATRAGSESWKAWFFGSLDPGSFITVDKPPLSLWLAGLSARIFGFSSFSILLPEALATIAAVAVLHGAVRRLFGPRAALLSALGLALTPVTVAIGRFNNPDALLVLLLVGSGWFMVRALETGRTRHLVWCGAFVGLAFMTKLLQGWMVVPALAAVYLLAGPPRLAVRTRQLALAGVSMVGVSAAWPVAVTVWPGAKPYIGGSTNGQIWNLIFGYDGFGRIFGGSGGAAQGASFGGTAGWLRMFNNEVGGQVAWLLPLAAVGLLAGLWLTRRSPRTDRRRAGLVLFGLWALVHIAVFSSQQGIFHPYYVSALAPALAALAGSGAVLMTGWARRSWSGVAALSLAIALTGWTAIVLLDRSPAFVPALRGVIAVSALLAIAALIGSRLRASRGRALVTVGAVAAAVAVLAGPAAYSAATVSRASDGSNVLAGPSSIATTAGPGGGGHATFPSTRTGFPGGSPPSFAHGPSRAGAGAPGAGFASGGRLSSAAIRYLEAHQGSARYLLAATGSQTTAPIIIATGRAVVTIGGFNGSDPAPTVAQLAAMVARGELRYVLVSSRGAGPGGGPGGDGSAAAITAWVRAHGTAVTAVSVSGGTLYRVG